MTLPNMAGGKLVCEIIQMKNSSGATDTRDQRAASLTFCAALVNSASAVEGGKNKNQVSTKVKTTSFNYTKVGNWEL